MVPGCSLVAPGSFQNEIRNTPRNIIDFYLLILNEIKFRNRAGIEKYIRHIETAIGSSDDIARIQRLAMQNIIETRLTREKLLALGIGLMAYTSNSIPRNGWNTDLKIGNDTICMGNNQTSFKKSGCDRENFMFLNIEIKLQV